MKILKSYKQSEEGNFENSIVLGNSSEVLKKFDDEIIDLVVTSPPYDDLRDYNDKSEWNYSVFKSVADQLFRVMKKGGTMVWVVGDKTHKGAKSLTSFKQALYFQEIGFNMYDVIIYEKTGSGPPHPRRYFNTFEYMFVLTKGRPSTVNLLKDKLNKWGGKQTFGNVTRREKDGSLTDKGKKVINKYGIRTNIWKYANGKGFTTKDKIAHKHPAIFPEKLAEDHILSWSNPGDLVLDPFGGSGTTIKKAMQLNRNWIYIDNVEEYCKLSIQRIDMLIKEKEDVNAEDCNNQE